MTVITKFTAITYTSFIDIFGLYVAHTGAFKLYSLLKKITSIILD